VSDETRLDPNAAAMSVRDAAQEFETRMDRADAPPPTPAPTPTRVPTVAGLPDISTASEQQLAEMARYAKAQGIEDAAPQLRALAYAQRQIREHGEREFSETLRRIPEWKDEGRRAREMKELVTFARSKGYSDRDIADALSRDGASRTLADWRDRYQTHKRAMAPRPNPSTGPQGPMRSVSRDGQRERSARDLIQGVTAQQGASKFGRQTPADVASVLERYVQDVPSPSDRARLPRELRTRHGVTPAWAEDGEGHLLANVDFKKDSDAAVAKRFERFIED
jgi:hypothetical protein